jgi:hypothetical protein
MRRGPQQYPAKDLAAWIPDTQRRATADIPAQRRFEIRHRPEQRLHLTHDFQPGSHVVARPVADSVHQDRMPNLAL